MAKSKRRKGNVRESEGEPVRPADPQRVLAEPTTHQKTGVRIGVVAGPLFGGLRSTVLSRGYQDIIE